MWTNKTIPLIMGQSDLIGQGQRQPPVLNRLLNARINKQGEIEKRQGFDDLSISIYDDIDAALTLRAIDEDTGAGAVAPRSLIRVPAGVVESSDTMYMLTDTMLLKYTYLGWVPRDLYSAGGYGLLYPTAANLSIDHKTVGHSDYDQTNVSASSNSLYTVVAWIENNALRYTVYDIVRGGKLIDGKYVGSATYCQTISDGSSYVGIVYITGNTVTYMNLSSPLSPASYTVTSSAYNTAGIAPIYAAKGHSASTFVFAYYHNVNGMTACFVNYSTGAVTSATAYGTAGGPEALAIEYDSVTSGNYVIAVGLGSGANNILTKVLNTSLVDQSLDVSFTTSTSSRHPIRFAIGFNAVLPGSVAVTVSNTFIVAQLETTGSQYDHVDIFRRHSQSTSSAGGPYTYRHSTLVTKCFNVGDYTYVGLGHKSALQSSLFFVAVGMYATGDTVQYIAGRTMYGTAEGDVTSYGPVSDVNAPASVTNKFTTAHVIRTRYDSLTTDSVDFTKAALITVSSDVSVTYENIGDFTYIAGGSVLKHHDGFHVHETGFMLFPELTDASVTMAGSGGSLSAGSYSWRVYYEANYGGQRFRSYGVTITATAVANDSASIVVPTLQWTQRANVAIVVYRTTVDPTAATPFYRVTGYAPSASSPPWYSNDLTADTVTVTDSLADASITDQEYDYRYTGELPHIVPSDIRFIAKHGNRVMAASNKAFYPSLFLANGLGLEFSDELETYVSELGGPITGIISLGNNFVVFKESAILVYGGQGPDNLGNGDYQDPYTVSHAVGCKNAASIARVPGGVVFAGDAGIYMLNESLQLEFIGKDVYSEYKENGTEVVSTVYNAKQNYVAFFASNTYVFVYFMLFGAWSVWTLQNAPIAATVLNDDLFFVDEFAYVFYDNVPVWVDSYFNGSTIATAAYRHKIETDYIAVTEGDVASSARVKSVKFVGSYISNAEYTIGVSYDMSDRTIDVDDSTIEGSRTYTMATPTATTWPSDKLWFEHQLARQRCSSIRVTLIQYDATQGNALTHFVLVLKEEPRRSASMSPNRSID